MEPNVFWFGNTGVGDATAHEAGSGENGDWAAITAGTAGHTLVFTGPGVSDSDPSGSRDTIIIPSSGSKEIDKTFVDDGSIMNQIPLAGTNQGGQSGGDNQYVFCIYFDGETASEPYLEMWDDANHNTYNLAVLGSGNADNSMVLGIVTTGGSPGSANWTSHPSTKKMAGDNNDHRLDLNIGSAIGSAGGNVYFSVATQVPSTASPFSNTPITTLRFTYT